MRNIDYIRQFAIKHKFGGNALISRCGGASDSHITAVTLSSDDCPVELPVMMDDIIFDVVSALPEDCFMQWMHYRQDTDDITFKKWIAEGCHYKPTGVDTSGMDSLRDELFGYVAALGQTLDERWGLIEDSDEDSDWDEEEEDEEWED